LEPTLHRTVSRDGDVPDAEGPPLALSDPMPAVRNEAPEGAMPQTLQ
jgi:hypothetical protein